MKRINNIVAVFLLLVNILIQPIVSIQRVFAEDSEVGVETSEVYQNEAASDEVIDASQEVVDSEPDVPIEVNGNEETEPLDTEENVEENIEENVEENIEENVEENIEENVEENIEENVEENIEEDVEEDVEEEKEAITSIVSTNGSNVVDNLRTGSKARYSFVVNNTGAALTDAIVRVTLPANYLETFDTLDEYYPGQGYASKVNAYIQGGNLLIDYTLDNLGVDQSQTFNFAFKTLDNGSLPNNTSIPIKAEVIREGQVLAATAQTNYHYITRQPQFRSQVTYPEETNSEDSDEDGNQRLTMIDFFFSMGDQGTGDGSGRSTINSIELYVKVPSGLQFDEQQNEGWVFDASTQTASYTFTPDVSIYDSELSLPTGLVLINNGEIVDEDLVVQAFYSFANGDYIEASSSSQTSIVFSERIQKQNEEIDYVIMTGGQITINPGEENEQILVPGENEIDIKNSDNINAKYDFHIADDMIIVSGATYAFEIPDIMKDKLPEDSLTNIDIKDENSGEIIGTWSLIGKIVTITFTDKIEDNDDRIFYVKFSGEFNDDLFEEGGDVVVNLPVVGQASAEVILKPKQEDYEGEDWKEATDPYILVDGKKVSTNKNPEFADWTVRVNDSMNSYESASFVDDLGPNQEIVGDIQVYRLVRNYKNDIVDRVLVTGLTPVFDGATFTVGLGEIEDAYEISYTTRLIRPDGGGNLQINNNARIILDGEGTNVNDSVQTEWSKDIPDLTKTGQVSSEDNNLIEWQIDYNFGLNNLGSSVTLTDVLSAGNVNIDSIKVIEVNTDIDGNVVGEPTREVNVTKTPTENGVVISDLDANGRAYRITFNSTVPFGMGEEGNNVINNNVKDDQGHEDDAEVTVDTTPDATKAGKTTVDEDGNPYIEWTITLNSKKIDVSTISIRDYFDGRYLEPAEDFKLSKDGVEGATNFNISTVDPDEHRIGFGLTITDAGPHTYTLTYRTNYTVAGLNEAKLTNDAEVVFEDGDGIDIGAEVDVNIDAPSPGVSKTGNYVVTEDGQEVIEWVVTFNQAKIKLEKGSTLTDTFTTENIALIPGELKVMADGVDVTGKEEVYSFEEQGYGFILTLNNDTNATFTLTFKTTADDKLNEDQTNKATLSWRGKDSSDDATVSKRDPGIVKSSQVKVHEDGTKTIDWTIDFNTNRHVIYDFVLTDTNLPASVTIKDVKINGEALPNEHFAIDYPSDGIFTVTAKAALEAKAYQLTYTTTLSAKEEIDNPKNTAEIIYRGGNDKAEEPISIPTLAVSKTATGIDKVADKTSEKDRINWVIEANTDTAKYLVNLVKPVLSDEIPEDQKLVYDSIKVEQYNSAKAPVDITNTLNIERADNSFSIELPDGAFQYRVTLQTEILFHPSVNEEKNVYTNTTTLSDDLHGFDSDTGEINYFYDNTNNATDKQGVFNDDTENIDWSVTLNPQGLLIPNATIRDTLSGPHHYLQDSFKVTDGEGVLLEEATYKLTLDDNSFELTFTSGELNHPLNITYSTRVDADHIGTYTATNKVELLGGDENKDMEEDNDSVDGRQWTYGGGGSGRTLTFTVNKLNRLDEPVVGTTFKLTRVTSTGTQIPLDQVVTTGADGTFVFTNARAGRYIMEETSTPNSYELLGETIYFMVAYTEDEGIYDITITDANWNAVSNVLVSKDGNILTVINEFKTQDITATKNWLPASLGEDDQHPTVWLKLYRKTFGQDEVAVNVELKQISGEKATESVTWTGLETFSPQGERYEYLVREVNAEGEPFTPEGYSKVENGLTITNTNIENITISGTKTWVDYDNAHNTRPDYIVVRLMRNGLIFQEKTVSEQDGWEYSFGEQAKYDENGREYTYEISEILPPLYEVSTEGFDLINTYDVSAETIDLSGTKTWDDWFDNEDTYENQKSGRPDKITVKLLQDDKEIDSRDVTADEDGQWHYAFENLPKYDDEGKLYSYSIEEDAVDNYETSSNGKDIVNTYQNTDEISINGKKVWVDYSNKHQTRPENIVVYLYQNNKIIETQIVKGKEDSGDVWTYEFTGLAKYDADGYAYEYKVDEVVPPYYVKSVDQETFTITNTYTNNERIVYYGQKVWNDYNNEFDTRPTEIKVTLYQNGEPMEGDEYTQTVEPNVAGNWNFQFNDLPKYASDGEAYTYTVKEEPVEGYTTTYVDNFVVNTVDPLKTSVVGQKFWDDYNNGFDTRPEFITVHLLQNGERIEKAEISADEDGQWFFSFTGLDIHDPSGKKYDYTVEEELDESAANIYNSKVDGFNIYNTFVNKETVSINGQKVWDDYNNKFQTRPSSILLVLYRDGAELSYKQVSSTEEGNVWNFTFEGLPKYDALGQEYVYELKELAPAPYTSETTISEEGLVIFTNTYRNSEVTSLQGTKVWEDNDDYYGLRPESITVTLYQNGKVVDNKDVEADRLGNWRYNFTNLTKYDESGNAYEYTVGDNIHAYAMEAYYDDIINKLITIDISGSKYWNDFENQFALRPDMIRVNLKQTVEGSEESVTLHSTEISAENNWQYAFTGVPKYDMSGNEYIYTIEEEAVEGNPLGAYTVETELYNLINTLITTEVEVIKSWNDFEDEYGLRPETITFNLLQNNEMFDSVTVSADDEWSHIFTDIPKFDAAGVEYEYTVTENPVNAYSTEIAANAVTNTLIVQDIAGTKVWNDLEDKFGLRPEAITVNLVQSIEGSEESIVLKTVEVTAEDEWKFEFNNIPVYDANGNEYIYTLTEEVNEAYTPVINNDDYVITNDLKLTEYSGVKVWEDNDDQFGLRPEAITVRLFQALPGSVNKTEITSQVVTADNNWAFTFSELPLVNAEGVQYIYTVSEDAVNAYSTEINDSEITNTLITVPIAGQKVWNDYNNKFETRPETITVNLIQNNELFLTQAVKAAEDGSWNFSFGQVPQFDADGQEYVYTITEEQVDEYNEPEINGTIITNTYVNTELTSLSGEKLWDDFNNRLESRPESITVVLLQNGDAYLDSQVVNPDENNKWIYSFTDLPKYDELGEAYEYTIEELAVEGYETTYGDNGQIINNLIPAISVSVGDYVWYDANKDGLQDKSDVPIEGVVLVIEDKDGNPVTDIEGLPVGPQVTDKNGYYLFDKLPADATYIVRIDQVASAEALKKYIPTQHEVGGDNSKDSSTWFAESRHLVEDGEHDPTLDFGFILKKVSVGDYVWEDINRDGLQDATDKPIAGVVLTIKTKDGKDVVDVNGQPVGPTTTDEKGWYTFENLPADETYVVTIDQEASSEALKGLLPTKDLVGDDQSIDSSLWTATSKHLTEDEERDPTLDFGFIRKKVSVGDYVWEDINRDGLQDSTDKPIAGVVLTIKTKDGKDVVDVYGQPVGPTTTDEKGWYTFENLPSNETYVVTIDQKASSEALKGLLPTKALQGNDQSIDSSLWTETSKHLTEDEERDPTLDFGFIRPSVSVGDYVWFDKDKDGIQDEGEPGIPGVVLEIVDEEGNSVTDIFGKPVGPVTTDENGKYLFENLPIDKTYTVRISPKDPALTNYIPTKNEVGDDKAVDSSTWESTSRHLTKDQEHDPTLDFGFYIPSGSVGDYVWFDKNKDGLQDETDIPLKGVVLTLEDEEGNPVKDIFGNLVQPQTTDENGFYIFENLPLGHRYTVRIDQAASAGVLKDYEATLESQGNDISIDSSTWFATSVLLTEDGQHDPTLDFGFIAKSDDVEEPTLPGKPGQKLPNTGEESWFTYAVLILVFGTTLLFMGNKRKEDH